MRMRSTESVKPTGKTRKGKTEGTAQCPQEKCCAMQKSRNSMSLEEKFLGGRLGTVMLSMEHPRHRGNRTTERNTAEMWGCHGEEGRRKKRRRIPRTAYCASASLQRSRDFPKKRDIEGKGKEEIKTMLSLSSRGRSKHWCLGGPVTVIQGSRSKANKTETVR